MLRARKHRFALCFRVLHNQYVERSAYANVFKFSIENELFERGKLNSRCFQCFHWFPAAMLESLRRAPTWRLHTKHYNFQWYLLPNNSSSEYSTSPKPWHVVDLLLLYDISISWLNLLHGKRFYFFTYVIIKLTCVTWKPPIEPNWIQLHGMSRSITDDLCNRLLRLKTHPYRLKSLLDHSGCLKG